MNLHPESSTPAVVAPTPVYRPTAADLDEMSRIRAVHDLLDVAPDLPLETKLSLLDYVAAVLAAARGGETAHA